ncbi:HalOD1 output domain-containing protein [Haladaptatus cibarius]|uniref:HalOD1 output domain-containing protein n=1 Tax=Haladaptatus cibarius TaxID=453847 RepID=UPI000678BCB2|nr:HalOD1 output domain-containing protein [Haladaptatus cibarius]
MSPKTATSDDCGTEQFSYQRQPNETPTEAVLSAVSAVSNRKIIPSAASDDDLSALEPLYEAIDPDALDALIGSIEDSSGSDGSVTFDYSDHEVTVKSTGEIQVCASSSRNY